MRPSAPGFDAYYAELVLNGDVKPGWVLKQTHEALEDGSFVLEVKDHGRMKIQVKDGVVSVTETSDAPDWSLSDTEAVRFLTSPEALYRNVIPKAVPGNWFPLSFGMSPLDEF